MYWGRSNEKNNKKYYAVFHIDWFENVMGVSPLQKNEYVLGNSLTGRGQQILEEHRIDNAIILAAGMSARFVPFNYEKPKGLLG